MSTPDVSIIIVNYKTLPITLACLKSIAKSTDSLHKEIIVIDNASNDSSVEKLKSAFPNIMLIANKTNVGFGVANNQGAEKAHGNFLLFLNSDTLLKIDTLALLFEDIKRHKSTVATCKLLNVDGSIQPQGGALPNLLSLLVWATGIDDLPLINSLITSYQHRNRGYFDQNHQVGWIGGTALAIKRQVFDDIGGFDPNIFMYGEDVELCIRLRQAGYLVDYFAKPNITHLGQASSSSKASLVGEFIGLKYLITKHFTGFNKSLSLLELRFAALLRILIFGIVGNRERKKIYEEISTMV